MIKTYHISDDTFITYKEHKSKQNLPHVIFLHGLLSNLNGTKSAFMHDFCEKNDIPYIRFNALGHEDSSGKFTDQSIDSWFLSAKQFIENNCPNGAILIGSSMGGWVSLLLAQNMSKIIKGLICISPAADFTEDIYNSLTSDDKSLIDNNGIFSLNVGPYNYDISHTLIYESRKHLLLNSDQIEITCPTHILHGICDSEVSYKKSLIISEKIISNNLLCTLVKTGNHSLSRLEDLKLLSDTVMNML